jgi:adenylate cyclase
LFLASVSGNIPSMTDPGPSSKSLPAAPRVLMSERGRGAGLAATWGAGGAATLLVAGLFALGAFERFELDAYDLRLQKTADPSRADPDIVTVMIGQASLDFFARVSPDSGAWPWTRDYYIPVVEYCRRGGAKAIVIDLVFTEQSRAYAHDVALGQACRRPSPAAAAVFMAAPFMKDEDSGSPDVPEHLAVKALEAPGAALPTYGSVRLPVGPLVHVHEEKGGKVVPRAGPDGKPVKGISGIGDVFLDEGGRYQPVLSRYRGRCYPSLAFAVYLDRVFPGYFERPPADRPALELDASNRLRIPASPPVTIPLSGDGRLLVNFRGPEVYATGRADEPRRRTYVRYEIADVINSFNNMTAEPPAKPIVPPERFAGKTVIVGADAPGLDIKWSPFGEWPGALFLTAGLDTLHRGDFRDRWPRGVAVLAIFALGAAVTALARVRSAAWGVGGTVAMLAAYAAFSVWALPAFGAWVDAVAPLSAGGLSFASAYATNFVIEGRKNRFLSRAFQHFVPPAVVDRILRNPDSLRIGGERRDLTVFFSDLAGFTSLSERLAPPALFGSLNEYLDRMTEVIHAHEGTLDKFVGDAIVAFWNAPDVQPDHALRACRAALDSQKELQRFRDTLRMAALPDFSARIGLNTGLVTVGFVGARKRFQYTVIGDDVNLASRLEGANKAYGTSILISEATRNAAGDVILAREVDLLRVKGKQKPVRVYELLALASSGTAEQRRVAALFEEGLAAYRARRWVGAREAFEAVLAAAPEDGAAKEYVKRCAAFEREPPPDDWDGVYDLKTK